LSGRHREEDGRVSRSLVALAFPPTMKGQRTNDSA